MLGHVASALRLSGGATAGSETAVLGKRVTGARAWLARRLMVPASTENEAGVLVARRPRARPGVCL